VVFKESIFIENLLSNKTCDVNFAFMVKNKKVIIDVEKGRTDLNFQQSKYVKTYNLPPVPFKGKIDEDLKIKVMEKNEKKWYYSSSQENPSSDPNNHPKNIPNWSAHNNSNSNWGLSIGISPNPNNPPSNNPPKKNTKTDWADDSF